MKPLNWRKIKDATALTLLIVFIAVALMVTTWKVRNIIREGDAWQTYQIDHKCKLSADAMDSDLLKRQVRDDHGVTHAVFIGSMGAKAYVCDDNVIYITHL